MIEANRRTAAATLFLGDLEITVYLRRRGDRGALLVLPEGTPDRLDRGMAKNAQVLYDIGADACRVSRGDRERAGSQWPLASK